MSSIQSKTTTRIKKQDQVTKTKKYKKENWNRPMGDADNELLSNYTRKYK